MKKYKLKLDYTADELRELKKISKNYNSPMIAIQDMLNVGDSNAPFINLQEKYFVMGHEDEFDFMADVNNVVMGTAIFPEKKYVVHDKVTDQYIYYSMTHRGLRWEYLQSVTYAETKTKEEWLEINPAYEPMLERVEE